MCIEIYEFDPAYFLSTTGLAWQAALKKTRVKLDIYVSLMVEKGIRDGIFHTVYPYVEANKNTL